MVMVQDESLGQRAGTLAPLRDDIEVLDAPDDDTLLARLRAGDEMAFRMLVDRHRPWLVRLCTRLLGQDAHAAEDAAQESLLKLHRAARRDGRPLRIRPWLTVVARNTCVDEQRRRRPDLPGTLPERAAPGDDPFSLDAALTDAWSKLAGRHREALYLREVLGFSYKEIGALMGLTMPATETLVFRARAALRREYERSGGTSFGCGVLGFHLARLGLGRRRDEAVSGGMPNAAVSDAGLSGFNNLTSRLAQFMTSLPGCGEQAVAKVLTLAAGVVVAAATVIPGLGPFGDPPTADVAKAPAPVLLAAGSGSEWPPGGAASPAAESASPVKPASLKALLGNAVPADWSPSRPRSEAKQPAGVPAPAPTAPDPSDARITPLRDAAAAARTADRPALHRPVRGGSGEGPLRSILPDRPDVDRPDRPKQPLRSLLAAIPYLIDPLPLDPATIGEPVPTEPAPTEPVPGEPVPVEPEPVEPPPAEPTPLPDRETRPEVRDAVEDGKDALRPGDDNVGAHEPALLRRRDR